MVTSCAALGCTERRLKGTEISFHSFPVDKVRRQVWTLALKRENFKPSNYSCVCSKHFSPECFDTEAFGIGRKLKPDAVPTIFNFSPHSASRGRKKVLQFERNAQKVVSTTESEMCSASNHPRKRRRTSKKTFADDYQKRVENFQQVAENSFEGTKKKLCLRRQKSRHAQALQSELKQKEIITECMGNMLKVELYPHVSSVVVKQEPEDSGNERQDNFVNEENHFTPDQFETRRADGLVKLKPNAVPTIFSHHKAPVERKQVPKKPKCCSVAGCKSNYRSQNEIVSTFYLPTNEQLKKKWLRLIPTDLSKFKKPVICMKHFSEECIVRTELFVVDGEVKIFVKTSPELKPDAVPTIFPKRTKNRRTSRKHYENDNNEEEENVLVVAKNNRKGTRKKLHQHRQKSCHAVKKNNNAQTLKQNQVSTESVTEMSQVYLYPHLSSVDVKQEPEDPENEELEKFVDEEFVEDPLVTTGCCVIIKEEPELELGVDVLENNVLEEPFQTSLCTDNIKEEPESTLETAGAQDYVGEFAEVFVAEWCPSSIKKEEVSDYVMLEPQTC